MTLEILTPPEKRKRGRPRGGRAFDHDQARRMHDAGMTFAELAKQFGVTTESVARACRKQRGPRLPLAGPPLPCSDERWRELEVWIERRRGQHVDYMREPVRPRHGGTARLSG